MMEKIISIEELVKYLDLKQLINNEQKENLLKSQDSTIAITTDPLYIRILFGIGAWTATCFLLVFIFISDLISSDTATIVLGTIFLIIGVLINKKDEGSFLTQLSLSLAFSGNILLLVGIMEAGNFDTPLAIVISQSIICIIMYPIYRSSIYRFISPLMLVFLIFVWIFAEKYFMAIHFMIFLELLLVGYLLLFKQDSQILIPLSYASLIMLPGSLLFVNAPQLREFDIYINLSSWPSSILLSSALIFLFIHLAGKNKLKEPWLILAIISAVILGLLTTPGILVAIGFLILGYAHDDLIITIFSYIYLFFFIILFYYNLNIDLAYKSWLIASTGVILLIIRKLVIYLETKELT